MNSVRVIGLAVMLSIRREIVSLVLVFDGFIPAGMPVLISASMLVIFTLPIILAYFLYGLAFIIDFSDSLV